MVDISFSSFVHHLYSACEFFKDITLLRASDRCILELNKWLNTCTGAFDWTHTSQILSEITEKSDQNFYQDIKLKEAIKRILKCDLDEENLTDSEILAPADCVFTACFLDVTSEDENDYKRNLKKIVKLLKPEGHLILFGFINATYFMVREDNFHMFKCDKTFVRKTVMDEGLIIDDCEVKDSKVESDLTDYKGVIFILAHKDK
ncbi:indolethylamine N-methyltransferase-like [Rhinoderma darwinii]|uniref:indolethylamine N-methyltransferase-like n=1 Tax=Rhinoderma darwinii TaxID=43563 RepID=UPI003F66692C